MVYFMLQEFGKIPLFTGVNEMSPAAGVSVNGPANPTSQ